MKAKHGPRTARRFGVVGLLVGGMIASSGGIVDARSLQAAGGTAQAAAAGATRRDAQDLLDFCVGNPDHCAISVYDIGAGAMAHLNPDRPQVLASTSKILFLLGYAQAVLDSDIDPDDTLSKEEWARYLTLDGFALKNSWEDLGEPDNPTWGELARVMIRHSDNAVPDHLYDRLGKKGIKNALKHFRGFHDTPLPIGSIIGMWANGNGIGGTGDRVADSYGSFGTAGFHRETKNLFESLQKPGPLATYRRSLCVTPPWDPPGPCNRPSPATATAARKFMTKYHFTRSTTRTYMDLMAAILEGDRFKSDLLAVVEPLLEVWLEVFPTLSPAFSRYGVKGGSLSDTTGLAILTRAHYMETGDGGRYVVAIFLQSLTDATNPPDNADSNAFAQQFALNPTFRAKVLMTLAEDDDRPELVPQIRTARAKSGGRKITVKARVDSAGPHTVRKVTVRLYLSDDNKLDGGDELLDEAVLAKVKGRKGKNVKLQANASASAEGRYLIVQVDPDDEFEEQDEVNNVLWERIPS